MGKRNNHYINMSAKEKFFSDIFENAGLGIGIVNLEGEFFEVNKAFLDLLGYSADELKAIKVFDIIHPDDYETHKSEIEQLMKGEVNSAVFENRYRKKDGDELWCKVNVTVIRDNNGEPSHTVGVIEDISTQKLIAGKLEEERNILDTLMKYLPDSIYFKDIQSRFIKVNKSTLDKFDMKTEEELIGKTDFDIYSKEHASLSKERENKLIKTGKPIVGIEEKETWPDGKVSWISSTKLPLKDSEGNIIGTFGISRDITQQKDVEIKLKESEERYKMLSEVTFEGIVIHDHGLVIDANQSLLNLLGYNLDEIIGKNIIHLAIHPSDWEKVFRNIERKYPEPYEVTGTKKDGSTFIAEIEARNIIFKGNKIRVAAVRDVTERHRSERIQDALYEFSEAVNNIDDIDDLYKRLHDIVKTLMSADNFYIALYDKDSDMISFPYFVDQFDEPPVPRKSGRGLTEYILRTGKNMLIDADLDMKLRKAGETDLVGEPAKIWLGVLLRHKEEVIGSIVLQDYENGETYGEREKDILSFVSEQIALAIDKKRSEDQLIKYSDELKELVASKDKFFSIVAHDLKSPFTALLGYSEMIANEYMEMSKDELGEFAYNMNDVAKKTFTLLENLLDWSRIQTGRMKFSPENFGIFQVAHQVVELYSNNAKKKSVLLRNRVKPQFEVYADANMIFTVLRNLTSNAIKFTNDGDEIVITAFEENNHLVVSVKDTGVGIDKENIDKLFKIDVHHSEIGTDQEKGTGLGLILCKELIEKNKGTIWVNSEIGKGSEFTFTLPMSKIG